jgi:putative ABC transport system ATP-binding protein
MSQILVGDDLHKSFGLTQALRGASIVLDEGEIVAVMGPSGSGKSTLLHCLAGILTPDSGEVHFAGRRIDHLPDRERANLRRTVFGFVFQFGQLVPELPAVENIALPLLLARRRRKEAFAAAAPWLSRLGLDGLGERLPGDLSGGQGQRVAMHGRWSRTRRSCSPTSPPARSTPSRPTRSWSCSSTPLASRAPAS